MKELALSETTVLVLLVDEGLSVAKIGERLGVAPETMSTHISRARRKLGAKSTVQTGVFFDRRRRPANEAGGT